MLTRLVLNPIRRLFGRPVLEPQTWQEAYAMQKDENERLERLVYQLQQTVLNWATDLNKPNVLKITQATIDDSPIGSESSAVGRFTKLGVGQAAPTSTEHAAYVGSKSGRQYLVVDGGDSGNNAGPSVVFAYNGTLTQGIGGYSSIGIGATFDKRLTIYSQSFDMVIAHASNSYCVDFVNPADGAAAATGTLTNAPSAGNPSYWLKIKISGNVRYIPCWS